MTKQSFDIIFIGQYVELSGLSMSKPHLRKVLEIREMVSKIWRFFILNIPYLKSQIPCHFPMIWTICKIDTHQLISFSLMNLVLIVVINSDPIFTFTFQSSYDSVELD